MRTIGIATALVAAGLVATPAHGQLAERWRNLQDLEEPVRRHLHVEAVNVPPPVDLSGFRHCWFGARWPVPPMPSLQPPSRPIVRQPLTEIDDRAWFALLATTCDQLAARAARLRSAHAPASTHRSARAGSRVR